MAEIVRSIKYDTKGNAYLCLQPKINPEKYKPYAIPESDSWMYSPESNPHFKETAKTVMLWMWGMWNLGLWERSKWAHIASVIEDGLADLKAAPPREEIVDLAVKKQAEENWKEAMKNAEFDSKTNTVKIVVSA